MRLEVGKRYELFSGLVTEPMEQGACYRFVASVALGGGEVIESVSWDATGTAYGKDGGFDVKCEHFEQQQVQLAQPVPEVGKRYQMANGCFVNIVGTRFDGLFVGDVDMGNGMSDRAIFEPDGTSIKAPGYRLEREVAVSVDAETKAEPQMRKFAGGATRNLDTNKLDYDGFFCPLVMKRFAEYMHSHRMQKDGTMRAADNWQTGIPLDVYIKSLFRHFMDLRLLHKGQTPLSPEDQHEISAEEALCAVLFNAQGYLHELLKAKAKDNA